MGFKHYSCSELRYLIYPIERNGCYTNFSKYEVFPSIFLLHPSLLFICTLFLLSLHLWVIRNLSFFVFQMASQDLDRAASWPLSEPPLAVFFIRTGPVLVPIFLLGTHQAAEQVLDFSLCPANCPGSAQHPFPAPSWPEHSGALEPCSVLGVDLLEMEQAKLSEMFFQLCPTCSTLKTSGGSSVLWGRAAKGR